MSELGNDPATVMQRYLKIIQQEKARYEQILHNLRSQPGSEVRSMTAVAFTVIVCFYFLFFGYCFLFSL